LSENLQQVSLISPAKQEFLARQKARTSFYQWCVVSGFKPAKHHILLINELQAIVDKLLDVLNNLTPEQREQEVSGLRLMVLMPPGSAKSTYISKLFPPWFLSQINRLKTHELGILACSHEAGLAGDFGRAARNLAEGNERWLGYQLRKDSRAAEKWATSSGGYYQSAGVGAGIAGRRMHLGIIDDFCGSEEDAGSKLFNDRIWNWYLNDFVVRLQPFAARVIIANHRNEDDLVGRLLAKEADKWRVIRLRLLIETEEQAEQDPLNRSIGEYLWPEYFTRQQVNERMANPRASGIEQQEPSPEKGGFFQADWFQTYKELPPKEELQYYCASDHAVSEKQTADLTCLLPVAFGRGKLWILSDVKWSRMGSKEAVEQMLALAKAHPFLYWWAEKGHISKSIGPFLQDRMMDEHVFVNIVQVTPVKDKMTRAQTIQGMMSMGMVMWPDAPWFQRARKELLMFPNGKHDDFVDALSHLGRGIHHMIGGTKRVEVEQEEHPIGFNITPRILRDQKNHEKRMNKLALRD
jgi:predicted phage terminase large subunit-like protein